MQVDKMKKADLVEHVERLEAAVLMFSAFKGAVEVAEGRKAAAVDIGISTARLRTVVDLCDEIHGREEADEGRGD